MKSLILLASLTVQFPQQTDISLEIVDNSQHLTRVQENLTQAQPVNLVFFSPHENENIANNYVKSKVMQSGGRYVVLKQFGNRLIKLKVNEKIIAIDPNRIYTHEGRRSTLLKLNENLTEQSELFKQALAKTEQLGNFILQNIHVNNPDTFWVAVHNNTDGYGEDGNNGTGTISIKRYQKKLDSGSKYLIDVTKGKHDEDDLFFVTHRSDFEKMKQQGWNAILQNPAVALIKDEDDGSLSVLAEMKGMRYINIEAERISEDGGSDHLKVQQQMVDFIYTLFQTSDGQ